MIMLFFSFDQQTVGFFAAAFAIHSFQPCRLIPGGHIVFAIARVFTFESVRSSRINRLSNHDQTSLAPLRAGWTRLRLCARPSCKIQPPPRQTFRQRERPASRKTGLPQVTHTTGSATAALVPSIAPFRQQSFVAPVN